MKKTLSILTLLVIAALLLAPVVETQAPAATEISMQGD